MRLALVAACLLVVVAVTISPSSSNPAPGIRTWSKVATEETKELADKKMNAIKDRMAGKTISPSSDTPAPGTEDWFNGLNKKLKELVAKRLTAFLDRITSGFRSPRDVDFESHRTFDSDLRAPSDLVSALEDASDILSSVEDVYNIIEGGSFEDEVSDLEPQRT